MGGSGKKEVKKERAKKRVKKVIGERRNKGEGDVEEEMKRGEGMDNGQGGKRKISGGLWREEGWVE